MVRFCPNCGTEVDEHAAFCPTCGQPLDDAEARPGSEAPAGGWGSEDPTRPETRVDQPIERPSTAGEEPAPPQPGGPAPAAPPGPTGTSSFPSRPQLDLPVTWPVNLSGWLIGIGAVVGILAMFLPWVVTGTAFGGFGSFVNVLFLLVLLAVAASVFFSTTVPQVPHQRLAILAIALVGLGIGLDRMGVGFVGIGAVVFLLGMISMVVGTLLLELGRDRPMAGPGGGAR